ncbi:MAG: CDP-diacylglycerol--serine O-phosphatidyltransferase [Candidatus Micrarchaeota archaeon]|nr:CDP-diacylglycerol--serine O-phosphatidyltransferase [Candidatus Micrarchaeota archaeon]
MDAGLLRQLIVLKPKDFLSLAAASCGFLAIYSTMLGYVGSGLLVFAAVIFDVLDGMVARMGKKPSANDFGRELDSLADVVSFGAAPAVIALAVRPDIAGFFAALVYLCCVIIRLALFNLQKEKAFYGMPSTVGAIIVIAAASLYPDPILVPIVLVVSGALMVSSFRIEKPVV